MACDISIIIPHYNSPKTLKKLIQTIGIHNNVEIIIIDDKSDKYLDEFTSIKKACESEHIIFLNNNTALKGAGTCRNIGLDIAHGRWLLFADADDYFTEKWYLYVERYLNNSNIDIVYFKPTSISAKTGRQSNRHTTYEKMIEEYRSGDAASEVKLRYYWCVPWSKLIRKELIDNNQVRFDEVRYSNDVMFSAKSGYFAEMISIDQNVIYTVTDDENTLTKNMSEEAFFIRCNVECSRYVFLNQVLDKSEKQYLDKREGIRRLYMVFNNRYGFKALVRCLILVLKSGYPLYAKRI